MNNFEVIKGDVDSTVTILKEVSAWGRSIGLNVWKDEYLTRDKLTARAEEENFCVGKVDETNACCMILQWSDYFFWPKAKENEAGYLHKLAVRRGFEGKGLPAKMVEFALSECRKRNIPYLRLDTGWSNTKLCNMYKSLGFELVDKFLLDDGGAFALFEMKVMR